MVSMNAPLRIKVATLISLLVVTLNVTRKTSAQEGLQEFEMANGDRVMISNGEETPSFWCNAENMYSSGQVGLFVVKVVASPSKTSLLCFVAQGSFRAFSYDHLLWMHRAPPPNTGWVISKLFEKTALQSKFPLKPFISEIGAVDDINPVALLKIGEQSAPEAPFKVSYSWQTWDIVVPRLLGKGLSVENGLQY